jgi:hypothetical protein
MALTEAQRAELDALVAQLEASGANETSIQQVVNNKKQEYESGSKEQAPIPQNPKRELPGEEQLPLPAGVLSALGTAALGGASALRPAVGAVGSGLASLLGQRAVGSVTGAGVAAAAPSSVPPMLKYPAVLGGYTVGKMLARGAGKALSAAADTTPFIDMPAKLGGYTARDIAGRVALRGATKALPYVGWGLLAADAANMAYPKVAPYLRKPIAPEPPADPMVAELLRRRGR